MHVQALGKANADVLNDIGVCHFEMSEHDKALKYFSLALENTRHAPSYSNRANCLRNLGRLEDADSDYTRAIEIDKGNPKAYLSRALLREGPLTKLRRDKWGSRCHRSSRQAFLFNDKLVLHAEGQARARPTPH